MRGIAKDNAVNRNGRGVSQMSTPLCVVAKDEETSMAHENVGYVAQRERFDALVPLVVGVNTLVISHLLVQVLDLLLDSSCCIPHDHWMMLL